MFAAAARECQKIPVRHPALTQPACVYCCCQVLRLFAHTLLLLLLLVLLVLSLDGGAFQLATTGPGQVAQGPHRATCLSYSLIC